MTIVERCVHLHIYRQYLKIEILKQHPLSRSQYHQQHTINLLLQIRPNRQILVLTVINKTLITHIVIRACISNRYAFSRLILFYSKM